MAQLGSIGELVFETSAEMVRTFSEYGETSAARIGAHDVGGAVPVLEFQGPATRLMDIGVVLNAALGVDVEADISKARSYCESGALVPVTMGGIPIGGAGAVWMIETADASRRRFDRQGRAVFADLRLTLKLAKTASTPTAANAAVVKRNVVKVKK